MLYKISFSLLFFYLGICFTCVSQDTLESAKKIQAQIIKYSQDTSNVDAAYNLSCLYSLSNNIDSALYFLNTAINNGYKDRWAFYDPDLENIRQLSNWGNIRSKITNRFILENPNIDTSITFPLLDMYNIDQCVRRDFLILMDKYGFDAIELDSIKIEAKKIDSINRVDFVDLIKKYGWPNRETVGNNGMESVFTIIQHSPLSFQKTYLPFIEESVKKGDMSTSTYAFFIDKMLVNENKKQRYGTQYRLINKQDNTYEPCPIEDELNLNKRRAEMGLEPMEGSELQFGVKYPNPK